MEKTHIFADFYAVPCRNHPPPVARANSRQGNPRPVRKFYKKSKVLTPRKESVNTMTENTKVLGIRLSVQDKERLSKHLTRECVEGMLRQMDRGEIVLTSRGVEIKRVNTISESVNTPDCENCEYVFNALDMSGFDEVCEFKGIDRQKALDKCVQMLWR